MRECFEIFTGYCFGYAFFKIGIDKCHTASMMYGNADEYSDIDDEPPPGANIPVTGMDEENPLKRNREAESENVEEIGNGSLTSRISNVLR